MIGPDFQPSWIGEPVTQGVALGWHEAGALPLNKHTRPAQDAENANGAAPYQPGATPQETNPSTSRGPKVRPNGGSVRPGFQPSMFFDLDSQGVALGWRRAGALPLRKALL